MSLEDKFDKTIRDKIGEADFPFEESNWQGASRMIDAERAAAGGAKSSKLFLLFGSLFLVIAGVTFFSLMTNTSDDKAIATNRDNVTNAIVNAANASEVSSAASSANEVASSNNVSENNSAIHTVNSSNDINSASGNSSSAGNKMTDNTAMNGGDKVTGDGTMNGGDRVTGGGAMNTSVNGNGVSRISKKYAGSNAASVSPAMYHLNGKGKSTVAFKAGKQNPEPPISSAPEEDLNAAANAAVVAESADYLTMRKSVLQIWSRDEVIRSNGHDFIRYDEDYFVHKHRNKYYLNAEMGAAYLLGWQTANGKDGAGLNGFAGVNFGVYLPKKFALSVGAQVYNVANISQPFYSQTKYDYDFGYTGTHTNITANSLIYASVPVKISYPVSKRSRVGAGINVGMLFSGMSTVETYNESDLVKSNVTDTKVKGYYQGVNKMNTMISAFYTHRLNRRFSLNGEVMLGLSDVYLNSVTKNGTFERNMGARLSLQYDIIRR